MRQASRTMVYSVAERNSCAATCLQCTPLAACVLTDLGTIVAVLLFMPGLYARA